MLFRSRNILGQLAPDPASQALAHIEAALAPGGALLLGPNDRAGKAFVRAAPDMALYAAMSTAA